MKDRPLYVFGAGGHGKVVAEAARFSLGHRLHGFLDDDRARWGMEWDGVPILGGRNLLGSLEADAEVALGLGGNARRVEIAHLVVEWGRSLATLVHPSAVIARGALIGPGTYVAPMSVVHTDAFVGRGCIVNTGAVVEHDCHLGDFVHVSPRAVLGGGAFVGEGAHVALGAVVLPGLTLGPWATLGAGAVMIHSIPDAAVAVGVPARVRDPKRRQA